MLEKSKTLIFGVIALALAGCAGSPLAPNDGLPANADRSEGVKPLQQAANNRGLYLTQNGIMAYLQPFECNGLEMQMHRGHPKLPENSQQSVTAALEAGAPVVEIDVTIIDDDYFDDGYWVAYHDQRTGRAAAHPTDSPRKVRLIETEEWPEYRLRHPETGNRTSLRPNFAREVFETFAAQAEPGQQLHIEIKHEAEKTQLHHLDAMVRRILDDHQIRYSSFSLEHLSHIRDVNKSAYMGLIQKPHYYSVKQLRDDLDRAASGDADYDRYGHWADVALSAYSRASEMSHGRIARMERHLGSNSGLHVDVRDAVLSASSLKSIQNSGTAIATYSINGQDYHESRLAMAQDRGFKPDSVIVDETPYGFCGRYYQPERNGPMPDEASSTAQFFNQLPLDADLRVQEHPDMAQEGLYVNLSGDVKTLPGHGGASTDSSGKRQPYAPSVDLSVGERQREQDFSLDDGEGPLVIDKETFE